MVRRSYEERFTMFWREQYIKKGYPISSAMIEGTCRHVIGSRMKGFGRRWEDDGADAMACMRALFCGGEWDEFFAEKLPQPKGEECKKPGCAAHNEGAPCWDVFDAAEEQMVRVRRCR